MLSLVSLQPPGPIRRGGAVEQSGSQATSLAEERAEMFNRPPGEPTAVHPWGMTQFPASPAPHSTQRITRLTRRDILDYLSGEGGPWWGRFDEIDFLGSLYDPTIVRPECGVVDRPKGMEAAGARSATDQPQQQPCGSMNSRDHGVSFTP